jgi:pimeloyl-ACP methyl ester carboxylesterase
MFGDHLDALGDVCRLLFVDQRSQGRSDPAPPETWTLAHQAADVEALAHSLGLERYAVLGHSFGAFVALACC